MTTLRSRIRQIECLEALAKNTNNADYQTVTQQIIQAETTTDPRLLEALAVQVRTDAFCFCVGLVVAENPHTPAHVLTMLARREFFHAWEKNHSAKVYAAIAARPDLPADAAKILLTKRRECPLQELAENPATPSDVLEQIHALERDSVNLYLAGNPSTPAHILEKLQQDRGSAMLVCRLMRNPSVPLAFVESFLDSDRLFLRSEARCVYQQRQP